LSLALVGHFDGKQFTEVFRQELDFGTYAYAFQSSLMLNDRPVGIAWVNNWWDVPFGTKYDLPCALTLPRQLTLCEEGKSLATPPVDQVLELRQQKSVDEAAKLKSGQNVSLPSGAVEIIIELDKASDDLRLDFQHSNVRGMGVVLSPEGLEILPGEGTRKQRLLATGARPWNLRIFLDVGVIEVYANGGRWTGTYRVPDLEWDKLGQFTGLQLSGKSREQVAFVEIWKLQK